MGASAEKTDRRTSREEADETAGIRNADARPGRSILFSFFFFFGLFLFLLSGADLSGPLYVQDDEEVRTAGATGACGKTAAPSATNGEKSFSSHQDPFEIDTASTF